MKPKVLVLALVALGLAAPVAAETSAIPAHAAVELAKAPSTLDDIRNRGTLVVGNKFGFAGFNYRDASGRNDGYMAELARALAKRMLGDESKLEFRKTTDETRFEMLDRKEIDLIVDLTPKSEEKLRQADFSDEIFQSGSGLLVKKGSPIHGVADLGKGVRVAYVEENKDIRVLRKLAPDATYMPFDNSKDAFAALAAGKADAFTQVVTHLYRAAQQDPGYVLVSRFTDKPYYIAFRKGDSVLRDDLNAAVRSMKQSGELDALYTKWFAAYGGDNVKQLDAAAQVDKAAMVR